MLKAALFGCLGIPLNRGEFFLHGVAVEVIERHLTGGKLCHLEVSDVVNLTGMVQDCGNVGGKKGLLVILSDDHRGILARRVNLARMILEHYGKRIRAAYTDDRLRDGINRAALVFLVIVVDKLDQHFGVGLRVEYVPVTLHLGFELLIVFNDSVMYADNERFDFAGAGTGTVSGYMGMRVLTARGAVGCPTGMTDAARSGKRLTSVRLLDQILQPSERLDNFRFLLAVAHRDTRRVISAVLKFRKTFKKDRARLFVSDISDYSAHKTMSPIV